MVSLGSTNSTSPAGRRLGNLSAGRGRIGRMSTESSPSGRGSRARVKAAPAATLTWGQVAGFRLRRHHLHERASRSQMLEVVADIAGLHAQLMSSAELTLW